MDNSIFRLSLDIHSQTTQEHLSVKKGDTARKIIARLADGGRPYTIGEGCYAVFKGKKPDGNVLYNSCTIENNCIVYEFTEQTASSAGYMPCELQLYGPDGKVITSPKFAVIVSGLVYDDSEVESSSEFTALEKAMADVAELKKNGLKGDQGPEGPQGPTGPMGQPFYIELFQMSNGAWAADWPFEDIQQAEQSGRQLVCTMEAGEAQQEQAILPLVKTADQAYTFGACYGGVDYLAVIWLGDNGNALVSVTRTVYVTDQTFADEKYFDITEDGTISLKPEYRGACPDSAKSLTDAISDNGIEKVGSKNHELPQVIIIPDKIGDIPVTQVAKGMFMYNPRLKQLTIPAAVRVLQSSFCYGTANLQEVNGTENVQELKAGAFSRSGIRSANFPNLIKCSSNAFYCCANLVTADFGSNMDVITTVPKNAFLGCSKLTELRCGENITAVQEGGFLHTYQLKSLPFLPKLKSIGTGGILCSRVAYDWNSLTGCTFTGLATPKQFYTTNYWTGRTFTPCYTALRSTFEQYDPRWADKPINGSMENTEKVATFSVGCSLVSAAMVYSALAGVDLESPEEFIALAHAAKEGLAEQVLKYDLPTTAKAYLEAFDGIQVDHRTSCTAQNLQAVYDALASGALVLAQSVADQGGNNHVIVLHGINASGELMVTDCSNPARELGIYEAATFPMPVQNRVRADCYFLIVTKEG